MEKNGIGTDASIPTHINNIIERKYVEIVEPGRSLRPTSLGVALVRGYCEIDPELVLPSVRSNIEKSCEMIAKGKADFSVVLNHCLKQFHKKFQYFQLSIGTMERLVASMMNKQTQEEYLSHKIPLKYAKSVHLLS